MNTIFVTVNEKSQVVVINSKVYHASVASIKRVSQFVGIENGRPVAHSNGNVTTYIWKFVPSK